MPTTYGPDRMKIYKYAEANGFKLNDETHAVMKALLKEYVDHQNANLVEEVKQWRNHQPKCEMFLAKQMARRNSKKVLVKR